MSNNRVEWAITSYAVNSSSCMLVPMYEAQAETDRKYIIENSDAKILVVATEKLYMQMKDYVGKIGKLEKVICFDAPEEKEYSYKRLMNGIHDKPLVPAGSPDSGDVCVIIYTSGTSGKPKGVELTHMNILSNMAAMNDLWHEEIEKKKGTENREVLCFLPWSHIFGQTAELHGVIGLGEKMAIAPNRDELLSSCEILRPTQMAAVPILMNKIYDGVQNGLRDQPLRRQKIVKWAFGVARERNHNLEFGKPVSFILEWKYKVIDKLIMSKIRAKIIGGKLTWLGSGAAALPMYVLHFFEDVGIPICEGYGLTETSPVVTSSIPGWSSRRLGCVGVPLKGISLKILNPDATGADDEFLPSDVDGEICVSGPNVMKGYRNNPEANAESFFIAKSDGLRYFKTGDQGRMIENKFLKVTGRIKEQYKLENGKYVVPSPIEDLITRSFAIHQAFIYGDNREFNIVLIVPELLELRKWAVRHKVLGAEMNSPLDELISMPEIQKLISMEVYWLI